MSEKAFQNPVLGSPEPDRAGRNVELSIGRTLLVLACVAVLGVLLFPFPHDEAHGRRGSAKNDCVQLVNAIKMFYFEYNRYPVSYPVSMNAAGEGPFESDRRLMDVLMNIHNDLGRTTLSPRGIALFEPSRIARKPDRHGYVPETGVFNDPWGTPYRVYIDLDMDGKITLPPMYRKKGASPLVEKGVIVHSAGKDRDFDKIRDNVKSWE